MSINPKDAAALKQPDTKIQSYEMTPERKEKFSRVSAELIDFIKSRTEGPIEAYAIVRLVCEGLEKTYGIRGNIFVREGEQD